MKTNLVTIKEALIIAVKFIDEAYRDEFKIDIKRPTPFIIAIVKEIVSGSYKDDEVDATVSRFLIGDVREHDWGNISSGVMKLQYSETYRNPITGLEQKPEKHEGKFNAENLMSL